MCKSRTLRMGATDAADSHLISSRATAQHAVTGTSPRHTVSLAANTASRKRSSSLTVNLKTLRDDTPSIPGHWTAPRASSLLAAEERNPSRVRLASGSAPHSPEPTSARSTSPTHVRPPPFVRVVSLLRPKKKHCLLSPLSLENLFTRQGQCRRAVCRFAMPPHSSFSSTEDCDAAEIELFHVFKQLYVLVRAASADGMPLRFPPSLDTRCTHRRLPHMCTTHGRALPEGLAM